MSVELHTLSNGLRVATEEMPGLQSVSVGVWVSAGGRHERLEQNGIAHFLEHMAFKGTKSRSALAIAEAIEDVGGYINAYTSREVTAYYVRLLKDDVALGVDILADILQNSTLDEREIEIERGVILQEIGQTNDTPDDIVFDWLQETAYRDQALGRSILGPTDNVSRFTQANLAQFIQEHYSPDRLILAAAGGVTHEEMVKLAEEKFGHMSARAQTEFEDSATFTSGDFRKQKELEQAHFTMAFESPSYRDDDIYTAQIYAIALGGGMSSRLFQEIREKRGLCYSIFAQAGAFADTGLTTIYAGTSDADVGDLAMITVDEMKRAVDDMSEAEVNRARAQMKAGMLMGLESASNRAERLARMIQVWDKVPDLEDTVRRIDAVTLDTVKAYAEKIATQAQMAVTCYGPVSNVPSFDVLESQRAA